MKTSHVRVRIKVWRTTKIIGNARYKSVAIMIEKWVIFKRDYLEISFYAKIADTTVRMNADDIMVQLDSMMHSTDKHVGLLVLICSIRTMCVLQYSGWISPEDYSTPSWLSALCVMVVVPVFPKTMFTQPGAVSSLIMPLPNRIYWILRSVQQSTRWTTSKCRNNILQCTYHDNQYVFINS